MNDLIGHSENLSDMDMDMAEPHINRPNIELKINMGGNNDG